MADDRATAVALKEAWHRFDEDGAALVAVLTGDGGHFSAGADLKAFDLIDDPDGFLGFTRLEVTKPTVAAIEGYCVAGGLEMALWCDLRVASKSAVFGCLERRFGVPLVDGGTQRLPLVIGLGRALDLILTGRQIDAAEASAMGLVNRVVEVGEALTAAIALADEIARFPQTTLRSDRLALYRGLPGDLDEERRLGLEALSADGAHAIELFRAGEGRGDSKPLS
jgi:enoyl-CoA hydratase